jgi:DNA-binding SARP family transcriptional activator
MDTTSASPQARAQDGNPDQRSLRLLGGFQLTDGRRPISLTAGGRRLVAYLAIAGRSDRHPVAVALWPSVSVEQASTNLRTTVWRLSRVVTGLVSADSTIMGIDEGVAIDVAAFRRAATTVIAGRTDDGWMELAALGPGDLLPGWYDEWVLVERERLRQLRLHALEALARRMTSLGRYAVAVDAAFEAISIEPMRESARRVLLEAYLAEGNVVEAVRHFDAYRRQLMAELGLVPSAALAGLLPERLPRPRTSAARTPQS